MKSEHLNNAFQIKLRSILWLKQQTIVWTPVSRVPTLKKVHVNMEEMESVAGFVIWGHAVLHPKHLVVFVALTPIQSLLEIS
jgi:hypothetical protein